jgi:hypothetical protein
MLEWLYPECHYAKCHYAECYGIQILIFQNIAINIKQYLKKYTKCLSETDRFNVYRELLIIVNCVLKIFSNSPIKNVYV